MSIEYIFEPYKSIGRCKFGMSRSEIFDIIGTPISTTNYGYPVADGFLDEYDFFYLFSNNKEVFEAAEIFPIYMNEPVFLIYNGIKIEISSDIDDMLSEFHKLTDDITKDEDGYSCQKLGVGLFCPENEVENIIFFKENYYD